MFFAFSQANALLLASYSTGNVIKLNTVATAINANPATAIHCPKPTPAAPANIKPPITNHCDIPDVTLTIGTKVERVCNQL